MNLHMSTWTKQGDPVRGIAFGMLASLFSWALAFGIAYGGWAIYAAVTR